MWIGECLSVTEDRQYTRRLYANAGTEWASKPGSLMTNVVAHGDDGIGALARLKGTKVIAPITADIALKDSSGTSKGGGRLRLYLR